MAYGDDSFESNESTQIVINRLSYIYDELDAITKDPKTETKDRLKAFETMLDTAYAIKEIQDSQDEY